jgi:hypothetical protein
MRSLSFWWGVFASVVRAGPRLFKAYTNCLFLAVLYSLWVAALKKRMAQGNAENGDETRIVVYGERARFAKKVLGTSPLRWESLEIPAAAKVHIDP